jgi:hypothetical protein
MLYYRHLTVTEAVDELIERCVAYEGCGKVEGRYTVAASIIKLNNVEG